MIVFSMELINFLIAHECDHLFGSLLPLAIQSQDFVFSPFGRWQGSSGPWGCLPEWECKTYRHSSSIAHPKGAAHEGRCPTNAPIYIQPPPPRSGDAKQILPLTGDAAALAHTRMPEQSLIGGGGGGGLSLELIRFDTRTVSPHRKRQVILHAKNPQREPPQKLRRVHPERGRKQKTANDNQPKEGRERGKPYAEKIVPKGPR